FLLTPLPPSSTLFPYTTLFRSPTCPSRCRHSPRSSTSQQDNKGCCSRHSVGPTLRCSCPAGGSSTESDRAFSTPPASCCGRSPHYSWECPADSSHSSSCG